MSYIDVTGKTEDEAIRKGLEQLGMDRDDVSVEILERAKSGFLGIGSSRAKYFEKLSEYPITWGSVKNQFFAAVFTPEAISSNGGYAIPLSINLKDSNKYMRNAVAGFMGFEAKTLDAGQTWNLGGSYYVGPKELDRLYSLGAGQEEVMNYGWFGFVSRPLSRLLNWIHSIVATFAPDWGWGWSIIILTIIVRAVIWPLTSVQIKSAQRMAKLQKPLKEIREKFYSLHSGAAAANAAN